MELKMSEDKLDAILKSQLELNGQLQGLTIAVALLFTIEGREVPGGAADRTLSNVGATVDAADRQLPDVSPDMRAAVIAQLRRCLQMASDHVELAKRRAPTSQTRN